ncbi:DNA phosphorothioation-dependent restriction protein DptF [Caryophanon latum]|uniref:DNA phosphorothioation-dependent restriction protein DptF n=1 Tax=Caryophanon latum TaxID=33977 RepID=A0A1C0YJG8_9BACL|nr:DNA phosphorothioation-dependent restriction protein DptF [Caryophanon latum]OCS87291.1 DNA phosphorothioation-dependent restriction protein DptF [Caryophanon latum]
MEKLFLSFLGNSLPHAALCAKQMEELFFIDASGALAKSRLFIEEVIKGVLTIEEIELSMTANLYEKLNYLHDQEYMPKTIYQAFDVIRRAGNKAVHDAGFSDMSQVYSAHKKMYEIAVWYYEVYTSEEIKLPVYEVPKPIVQSSGLTEEDVERKIAEMFQQTTQISSVIKEVDVKENPYELSTLKGSYLEREIMRLRISAAEAVENAQSFSEFKKYLHIKRPIQEQVERTLISRNEEKRSNLILLCGSVGDGKSHLLAYLNETQPDLIKDYKIYNDATESFSPNKTALQTLEELFKNFSDQHFEEQEEKVIIAINLGVLHNFINHNHEHYTYEKLKAFITESQIFEQKVLTNYSNDVFDLISFADYQVFELVPGGTESSYLTTLIKKICVQTEDNPFYLAYSKDIEEGRTSILHENYMFLSNVFVQKQIVNLVIQAILQFKISVSSRHFLNFIADLLIPNDFNHEGQLNEYDRLKYSLPNILFNSQGRSQLLDVIARLNPIHSRNETIDTLLVSLNTLSDWRNLIEERIHEEHAKRWLLPFSNGSETIKESFELFVENLVAILYLTDSHFAENLKNPVYQKYVEYVYAFNKCEMSLIKEFYRNLKQAIFNWKGTPLTDYIYLNRLDNELATAQKLKLNAKTNHLESSKLMNLHSFKPFITVKYADDANVRAEFLEVDYSLYELLTKVVNGYRPNKKDAEDATTFVEFLEKIMLFGEKSKELIFDFIEENVKYSLKIDEFDSYVFEKVD